MFNFFKDAYNELSHVVWPTKKESRTYMYYTVGVITVMTIILSLIGMAFKEILTQGRHLVNPNAQVRNIITPNDIQFTTDDENISVKNTENTTENNSENSENTVSETENNTNTTVENTESVENSENIN